MYVSRPDSQLTRFDILLLFYSWCVFWGNCWALAHECVVLVNALCAKDGICVYGQRELFEKRLTVRARGAAGTRATKGHLRISLCHLHHLFVFRTRTRRNLTDPLFQQSGWWPLLLKQDLQAVEGLL